MGRKTVRKRTRSTTKNSGKKSQASVVHAKPAPKPGNGPSMVEENVAVHGLYPIVVQTRSGVVNKVGSRKTPISASAHASAQAPPARSTPVTEHAAEAKVGDWLGVTARITGCVLGLGSMAVITPMLEAVAVVAAVAIGAQTVLHPPGCAVRTPDRKAQAQDSSDTDVKSREYYDKLGQVHYHTHTYMRDHSAQQNHSAA